MVSAFTADAVYGSRRTSGHGNSPCVAGSRLLVAVVARPPMRGSRMGPTSWSEPGGGVWIGTLQIMGAGNAAARPPRSRSLRGREVGTPGSRSTSREKDAPARCRCGAGARP